MLKNNSLPSHRLKILIRIDIDHYVGLAHGVRVSKILSFGKSVFGSKSGSKPSFQTSLSWDFEIELMGNLPEYKNFFDEDTPVHPLSRTEGTEEERAHAVVRAAQKVGADILLVDHPHLTKISWDIFAAAGIPVIAIDDEGGPVIADMIFNGTVLERYHHYPNMRDPKNIKAGGQYALINPSFRENPWTDPKDLSLITVIGSGDRACSWALELSAVNGPLTKLKGFKKTMLVGSAYPRIDALRENCRKHDISLHQGLDQNAMAPLLSEHMMGLITGGMIVYESLSLGLPVIIFPQEKNLPPEADYFMKNGCCVDLGYEGGMDGDLVRDAILKMAASHETRLDLSRNGKRMIDGRGMARTIEVLNVFFKDIFIHKNREQ